MKVIAVASQQAFQEVDEVENGERINSMRQQLCILLKSTNLFKTNKYQQKTHNSMNISLLSVYINCCRHGNS